MIAGKNVMRSSSRASREYAENLDPAVLLEHRALWMARFCSFRRKSNPVVSCRFKASNIVIAFVFRERAHRWSDRSS